MMYRYAITVFAFALFWGANAALAAGDGEKTMGLPQMDFSTFPSQLFWMMVMFVALYLVFGRLVLPALSGTIETRRHRIQNDLDQARNMKDEAQSVMEEYERLMTEAHTKASDLFSQMDQDIKRKTDNETQKIQNKSVEDIQKMEKRLVKAKDKALQDMDKIAAEIAAMVAEKIVGLKTNTKDAQTVVEKLGQEAA